MNASPRYDSQDQLVEQPRMRRLAHLIWYTVSAVKEPLGGNGPSACESKKHFVLPVRLLAALAKFPPGSPAEATEDGSDAFPLDSSAMFVERHTATKDFAESVFRFRLRKSDCGVWKLHYRRGDS